LRLHSLARTTGIERTLVGRIARDLPAANRSDTWLYTHDPDVEDARDYLGIITPKSAVGVDGVPLAQGVQHLDYLADGDVIAVDPSGFVRTLYRRSSPHNFILMTEQCNSYCLMCSQPPKAIDDSNRIAEHFRLVDLIDPQTEELGITGGEPTLFQRNFLRLVDHCETRLPRTSLHVLTNGRMFFYRRYAAELGSIAHHDLVLGIPLYSDVDSEHDYIVQARGAFEETVLGLQNLDRSGVAVEIRVVLHRLSIQRLPQLATFIARNFPWSCHVALMGLEMFGLVHKNLAELWIDPADYQDALSAAVEVLAGAGMHVSIYNHQLCVLEPRLWPLARKSISDWKNVYLKECDGCSVIAQCGGFFQSGTKIHSAHIRAIRAD